MSSTNTKQFPLVEAAIKKIEQRYAIGQEILEACGPTSPHGMIAQLAERFKSEHSVKHILHGLLGSTIFLGKTF